MTVRERIITAAQHRGGLKMQPCLALDPSWFADVQREIELILRNRPSSDPSQKTHPTNWTNPYGGVTQHSLYNTSGNTADTSSDHTHDLTGKSFVATECPALARLVNAFSGHAINFRLNGMMGQSGLSPHEENVIHGERVRVRLHLPVFTNDQVEMMLDGEKFHFREGYIYYFNNGCVHAAANGASQPRYHLVWDLFLDEWTEENIFNLDSPATPEEGLRKLSHHEATALTASQPWVITEYVASNGQLVKLSPQPAS